MWEVVPNCKCLFLEDIGDRISLTFLWLAIKLPSTTVGISFSLLLAICADLCKLFTVTYFALLASGFKVLRRIPRIDTKNQNVKSLGK